MAHEWIIDVLTDLKTFASANGMEALAEQLEDTQLVASLEIVSQGKGAGLGLSVDDSYIGQRSGTAGIG